MDSLNIRLSDHARDVMRRRAVTFDEVAEIIARPLVVATANDPRYPGNDPKRKYFGEDLCVVVAEERKGRDLFRTIVTVLFKQGDQWTDEDVVKR